LTDPQGPSNWPGAGAGAGDPDDWAFPSEKHLHALAPALQEAQSSWLAAIDSLRAPDRKTHELIRLACTVILRNPPGVQRHAMLAAEVGATWEEIAGSILLTQPSFGLVPALEAFPHARRGWHAAQNFQTETE
jgi:alkylhydroperoxidase/carboxymuconolactone decarboxylase family protein YurZ